MPLRLCFLCVRRCGRGCVGAPRVHVYARPPETRVSERGETHDAEVLRRGLDEAVKGFDRRTKLRTPLDLRHQ
uniref:Uncharacterized protein n=1 Tax=Oryza barthii TaxID=65489 RepID=A0A0D3HNZ1_9ORYZ